MSFRGNKSHYNTDSSGTNSDSDSNDSIEIQFNLNSNQNNLNLNSIKMALPQAQVQIPVLKQEYLNMVPDFYGETELLPRFIEISEKLVNKFYNAQDVNDFQNEYLMSSILAKIKGEAARNISCCTINSWLDLKTALLNTYADKRDCYSLNIEMTELKQENESPFEFYNRVQKLLNLQISYLSTHLPHNESHILSEFFRNYALRILLRGLKEPIGGLMRTKNPSNLNSALSMLTNDFQFEINQQKLSKQKFIQKPMPQIKPILQQPLQLTNFSHNLKYNSNPASSNNINRQNTSNFNKNSGFTNQYKTPTNVFKPNQNFNRPLPKPTPMSISTRNTFQPNSRQNQFNKKYAFEELYNVNDEQFDENEEITHDFEENANSLEIEELNSEHQNSFLEIDASEVINSN